MDNINLFSRERGRVIEFQQILYGYYQPNPLYGPNYILDVLLTFKKYRGKKMTVPVRRHAYLQQQFVGTIYLVSYLLSVFIVPIRLRSASATPLLKISPLPQL